MLSLQAQAARILELRGFFYPSCGTRYMCMPDEALCILMKVRSLRNSFEDVSDMFRSLHMTLGQLESVCDGAAVQYTSLRKRSVAPT